MVKHMLAKFSTRKTQVNDILKAKSEINLAKL
jgi:hypothetical protein